MEQTTTPNPNLKKYKLDVLFTFTATIEITAEKKAEAIAIFYKEIELGANHIHSELSADIFNGSTINHQPVKKVSKTILI